MCSTPMSDPPEPSSTPRPRDSPRCILAPLLGDSPPETPNTPKTPIQLPPDSPLGPPIVLSPRFSTKYLPTDPPTPSALVTLKALEELVAQKKLRKALHPTLPLAIYNYSHHVQFRGEWTDLLLQCRGLVLDIETGAIVARPMRKFFNYSEKKHDEKAMRIEKCDVIEKLDGSLGIYFRYRGEWVMASRGSFESRQAIAGQEMAADTILGKMDPEYTYLFEIIFPANRIVVDYEGSRLLILIAVINTKTGYDLPQADFMKEAWRTRLQMPQFCNDNIESYEALRESNIHNREGYIVRSRATGERVKVKFPSYLELHAVRTKFSLKHVRKWFLEAPEDRQDHREALQERLEFIPDEYYHAAEKEWDRMASARATARGLFLDITGDMLEMEYENVPKCKAKPFVCKYLRLLRANDPAGACKVIFDFAMHCVKQLPEPIAIEIQAGSEDGDEAEQVEEGENPVLEAMLMDIFDFPPEPELEAELLEERGPEDIDIHMDLLDFPPEPEAELLEEPGPEDIDFLMGFLDFPPEPEAEPLEERGPEDVDFLMDFLDFPPEPEAEQSEEPGPEDIEMPMTVDPEPKEPSEDEGVPMESDAQQELRRRIKGWIKKSKQAVTLLPYQGVGV